MSTAPSKESKAERFERLERLRLAERPDPEWCWACGYRLTTVPDHRCRPCQRGGWPAREPRPRLLWARL